MHKTTNTDVNGPTVKHCECPKPRQCLALDGGGVVKTNLCAICHKPIKREK